MENESPAPESMRALPAATTVARGRMIVLAVVGLMVVGFFLIAAGVWLRGAYFNPVMQLGRPVMFLGVVYLAWQGRAWARTVLVVWMGLIAISFAIATISVAAVSPGWAATTFAMAACAAYGAFVFQTNDDVLAYLRAEREDQPVV